MMDKVITENYVKEVNGDIQQIKHEVDTLLKTLSTTSYGINHQNSDIFDYVSRLGQQSINKKIETLAKKVSEFQKFSMTHKMYEQFHISNTEVTK